MVVRHGILFAARHPPDNGDSSGMICHLTIVLCTEIKAFCRFFNVLSFVVSDTLLHSRARARVTLANVCMYVDINHFAVSVESSVIKMRVHVYVD